MDSDLEQRMTRYLLGHLSEQEEAGLETRFLEDNGVFEELLATETDLRDAFERGELSGTEREASQQRLLASPRQEERQAFARALHGYRSPARPTCASRALNPLQRLRMFFHGAFRVIVPAMAVAMIVLITGMWWWAHKSDIPSGGPPTAQQNPVPEGRTLVGSLVRSGGQLQEVVVPSDANGLRLEARVEADFPSFDAILKTAEGRPMQTASNLKAEAEGSSKRVAVTLPSSQVAPGDYILTVRGLPAGRAPETVAEYAFRVRKD